jgi:mono/diheme cytochrome c family protein
MLSRPVLVASFALCFVAVAGCDKAPPVSQATPWSPADHERLPGEDDGPVERAPRGGSVVELVWAQRCVGCHAANGQGNGSAPVPNFSADAWQKSRSNAELAASIAKGRGAMPKFDLPASVVDALVAKVRSFAEPSP